MARTINRITDRQAVLQAIAEYDELGHEAFLEKYGFRESLSFWLVHDGRRYDSKAIVGTAYGHQHPGEGPLKPAEFSGGEDTIQPLLERLGFEVEVAAKPERIRRWMTNLQLGTVDGAPAPHKPLLALLALRRVGSGDPRSAPPERWADELMPLLTVALPGVVRPSPWEPIWRFHKVMWEVTNAAGERLTQDSLGDDPPMVELRAPGTACGLTQNVFDALSEDPALVESIRRDVVAKYLADAPTELLSLLGVEASPTTWWVNQGQTYAQERTGGYVWAPQQTKAGRPAAHHVAVNRLRPGDVILHYHDRHVRALGSVVEAPRVAQRPVELPTGAWGEDGYACAVEYYELPEPIRLDELTMRPYGTGPFNSGGGVNQGYMYQLPASFADSVRSHFAGRWPSGSPWASRNHWLFQAVPSRWDLEANLTSWAPGTLEDWRLSRYSREVVDGDDVALFASGGDGGVLALGTIAGEPRRRPRRDEVGEDDDELAIDVRLSRALDPPISRSDLLAHPVLCDLGVLRQPNGTNHRITDEQWKALMAMIDGEPAAVHELSDVVARFAEDLRTAGLGYGADRHQEFVRTFVVSLATKRFVILTGLSGSGKTRIAQSFGSWLGSGQLLIVAVRPDWTNPDPLLGYENGLSRLDPSTGYAWNVPEALAFILEAQGDPDRPYLLLLDEMNLAHVERYFADVLSGMESGHPVVPNLERLHGEWRLADPAQPRVSLPPNLFVVGTVNVDETTYMFSPKVLDRANTIEFRVGTSELNATPAVRQHFPRGDEALRSAFLAASASPAPASALGRSTAEALRELHGRLVPFGREFGHRTFVEAVRFADLLHAAGEPDPSVALDLQVLQKILPKYHGSIRELLEPLNDLGSWCFHGPGSAPQQGFEAAELPIGTAALPRSFDKIHRMARRLRANHFVSFAE